MGKKLAFILRMMGSHTEGEFSTMILFVFLKYLFMYHGLQGKEERKQRDQEATTVG